MSGTDIEHRSEIRTENRTTAIWVGLVVLGALLVLVLGDGGGGGGDEDARLGATTVVQTPTSETLTTTSPRRLPPVHGLTSLGDDGALVAFSTAISPVDRGGLAVDLVQAVVATDGVVVVLAGGSVHAAEPGEEFQEVVGCCVEELIPSSEPGHVWLRDDGEVALLQLEGGGFVTELDVGDGVVLGPASFGIVTRDERNVVRWHRPSFDPSVVRLPGDRRAIDSGGERLLVAAPATADRPARLETWSTTGNGLLRSYDVDEGSSAAGTLAPDGSVVAIPAARGWVVRDAATGALHGLLPEVSAPVWVGGNRFAASLDRRLVISDAGVLPMRWPVAAVAEQSP